MYLFKVCKEELSDRKKMLRKGLTPSNHEFFFKTVITDNCYISLLGMMQ